MSITPVSTQNQPVNLFQTIPEDVFYNIFSRVFGLNEIRSLLFTDKGINKFISLFEDLWRNMIVTHFQFPLQNVPISLPSKDFFKYLKIVNQNIKTGNYLFDSFQKQVHGVSCLKLYKDKCISLSNDHATVWDAKTKKELHTCTSKLGFFTSCLEVSGNMLIAGYSNGVVQCWDLDTYEEKQRFTANSGILCLAVHQNLLITGCSDGSIILWDLKSNEELHSFAAGPGTTTLCLKVHEDLLITGSGNGTIKIWDLKNKQELHSFPAHDESVNALMVKDNTLISCSDDKTIKIWDLNDYQELHTFNGHEGWVNGLETFGDYLFSCSDDHTVRVWDLKNKKGLHVIRGHKKFVNCLAMKDGVVYSGSMDKTIHVYNFNHDKPLPYVE